MTSLNSVTSASAGLLANIATNRTTTPVAATALQPTQAISSAATQVTLTGSTSTVAALDVVYTKPMALEPTRAWAVEAKDNVSALMARNRDRSGTGSLAEQWRGLGGALLSQIAATGTGYRQAVVDYVPAQGTERTQAMDSLAHSGVQNGAATVNLTIKTRSGQSVELKMAVNNGATGGNRGIQVEITSSGPLSDSERKALANLAEGFDETLEGLGQSGQLKLDVAKLTNYDSSAFASVDLTVKNPKADQALSGFSLRLGDAQKTLVYNGAAGEITLNLDTDMPFGLNTAVGAQQRQSAIDAHLLKFDAAAERGHADATLVELFKDAFSQLHSTPAGQPASSAGALLPALKRQVQPLLSGLADFQASFGGDFEKTNDRGAVNEIGRADYTLSQTTTARRTNTTGDVAVNQTQNEKLEAHYLRSRTGGMLDVSSGNYDIHKVNDHSTSTTLIESADNKLSRAVKDTEQHQLKTLQKLVDNRVQEQTSTPLEKRSHEVLR